MMPCAGKGRPVRMRRMKREAGSRLDAAKDWIHARRTEGHAAAHHPQRAPTGWADLPRAFEVCGRVSIATAAARGRRFTGCRVFEDIGRRDPGDTDLAPSPTGVSRFARATPCFSSRAQRRAFRRARGCSGPATSRRRHGAPGSGSPSRPSQSQPATRTGPLTVRPKRTRPHTRRDAQGAAHQDAGAQT